LKFSLLMNWSIFLRYVSFVIGYPHFSRKQLPSSLHLASAHSAHSAPKNLLLVTSPPLSYVPFSRTVPTSRIYVWGQRNVHQGAKHIPSFPPKKWPSRIMPWSLLGSAPSRNPSPSLCQPHLATLPAESAPFTAWGQRGPFRKIYREPWVSGWPSKPLASGKHKKYKNSIE
jgi:hypothetical protein